MSAKTSRRSVEKRGYTATEACWYLGIGKTKLHQLLATACFRADGLIAGLSS
jgi:hypothetical protein